MKLCIILAILESYHKATPNQPTVATKDGVLQPSTKNSYRKVCQNRNSRPLPQIQNSRRETCKPDQGN